MSVTQFYQFLSRLYPRDYRLSFNAEMLDTFATAAEERRGRGAGAFTYFALAEFIGVLRGAGAEWIAKLATDSSIRGRSLPDVQKMRPTGVPRDLWFGTPGVSGSHAPGRETSSGQRLRAR